MDSDFLPPCPRCGAEELACYAAYVRGQKIWLIWCNDCKYHQIGERIV